MGLNPASVGLLAELGTRFEPKGRSLMLGRQRYEPGRWAKKRGFRRAATEGLQRSKPDLDIDGLAQADGYAEVFFSKLGLGEIETLDFSDFEGAQHLWDLNEPVPSDWDEGFGFIFDGGTLEHVFNVPIALASMFRMLEVGGRFVGVNPLNSWVGHGLYQFGPDLVWSFWDKMCGCKVETCLAVDMRGTVHYDFAANYKLGVRHKLKVHPMERGALSYKPLLLYYEVERLAGSRIGNHALQNDYVRRWQEHSPKVPVEEAHP